MVLHHQRRPRARSTHVVVRFGHVAVLAATFSTTVCAGLRAGLSASFLCAGRQPRAASIVASCTPSACRGGRVHQAGQALTRLRAVPPLPEPPVARSSEGEAATLVIWAVQKGERLAERFGESVEAWAQANAWAGNAGEVLMVPGAAGGLPTALFGLGDGSDGLVCGWLPRRLPQVGGRVRIEWPSNPPEAQKRLCALAYGLGGYKFSGYKKAEKPEKQQPKLLLDTTEDAQEAVIKGAYIARDLINAPASHLGPEDLQTAAEMLAQVHGASLSVTTGAELEAGFPLIHAVGRAAEGPGRAPRLIDFIWTGSGAQGAEAPKVTLVGKGVTFDTGGLDIKPASAMLAMKKDMGGAANVLGLAHMIMAQDLPVRLRVLVPAVENSIAGNAFRPSDVIRSRKGLTVEIGNTDAEGRLILADAMSLADEEAPDLLIDMATLTGAHRVALGWDLPGVFTDDDDLALAIAKQSTHVADPTWRLPLWKPYAEKLKSSIADTNNIPDGPYAGAICAALFLQKFVDKAKSWVHIDFNAQNKASSAQPEGGADQGIRSLFAVIAERYQR